VDTRFCAISERQMQLIYVKLIVAKRMMQDIRWLCSGMFRHHLQDAMNNGLQPDLMKGKPCKCEERCVD